MGSEVPGIALCGFLAQPETEERELWGVAVIWNDHLSAGFHLGFQQPHIQQELVNHTALVQERVQNVLQKGIIQIGNEKRKSRYQEQQQRRFFL